MPDQEDTMGFLLVPLVIGVITLPAPSPSDERLADFARIRKAVDEEVYLVDSAGQERRVTILQAGDRAVTVLVGQQSVQMSRDAVVRVERMRDTNVDGVIKGALLGLLVGLAIEANAPNGNGRFLLQGVLTYGGLGYLFDRGNVSRQPLYKAPPRHP
jgi:hypothetical protein